MRSVRFVGQSDRAFPQLPSWIQAEAMRRLYKIAAAPDGEVPGTLSVVDDTLLRHFSVEGYLFTYSAPRARGRIVWVLRIARKR